MKPSNFNFLLLSLFLTGFARPSLQACDEQPEGEKTVLSEPCTFVQFVGNKDLDVTGLKADAENFFSFESLTCKSFTTKTSALELSCVKKGSFYLMKNFLSYGSSENGVSIKFELKTNAPNTYNGTKISISGKLSQNNGLLPINAEKEAGKMEFLFQSQYNGDFNIERFLNQRRTDVFSKLSQSNTFSALMSPTVQQPVFYGIFTAVFDVKKPNDQSFELVIKCSATTYYVIQNVPETISYHIAFFTKNSAPDWSNPGKFINKIKTGLAMTDSFSPIFESDTSAFTASDGDIVIINNGELRNLAEKYVSQSSPAIISEGVKLHWHIRDTQKLKKKAADITTAEDPPQPSDDQAQPSKKKKKPTKHEKQMSKKKRKISKRQDEENPHVERDKKIALSASFTENSDVVAIETPEYVSGGIDKLCQSVMPAVQLHDDVQSTIGRLTAQFSKIEIFTTARKMMLSVNITESFDLIINMINGQNYTVTANISIYRLGEEPSTKWTCGGHGRTVLLQQLVDVYIYRGFEGLYCSGEFEIVNMTEFWNASGQIDYLPRKLKEAYPKLGKFAVKNLKFKGLVKGEDLIINGETLVLATTKPTELVNAEARDGITDQSYELIDKCNIEMIVKNESSKYDLMYCVGVGCQNQELEHVMRYMFNKNVQSYPWVKCSNIGVLMSNETIPFAESFNDASLRQLRPEKGIQIHSILDYPRKTDCMEEKLIYMNSTEDTDTTSGSSGATGTVTQIVKTVEMTDKMCLFLHSNRVLFDAVKTVKGTVNETDFVLKSLVSKSDRKWIDLFGNNKIMGNQMQLQITSKKVPKISSTGKRRNEKTAKNSDPEDMKFVINGHIKINLDNEQTSFLRYDATIAFDDTEGRIKLILVRSRERNLEGFPFRLDDTRNGYSPLTADGFRLVYITVKFSVGIVPGKEVFFGREAEMQFDLLDPKNNLVKALRRNYENNASKKKNTFLDIFKAYGVAAAEKHIILKNIQALQNTEFIFSRQTETFKIEPHAYQFKKGINFFGECAIKTSKDNFFFISVDETLNTIYAEVDFPYFQLNSDGDFILTGNSGPYNTSGLLVIEGSTRGVTVRYEGFLRTIGFETEISFDIPADGQFSIQYPLPGQTFKLFKETEATMTIKQASPITELDQLDPTIEIDLAASLEKITAVCKHRMWKVLSTVDNIVNEENFNQFTSESDKEGKTVKQLMRDISDRLDPILDNYEDVVDKISMDCSIQCANELVNIYGYSYKQKYQGNPSLHQVIDPGCITECELMKGFSQFSLAFDKITQILDLHNTYEILKLQQSVMQVVMDKTYDFLYLISKLYKKKGRLAGKQLNEMYKKYGASSSSEEIPMTLIQSKLSRKLMIVKSTSKCVKGFDIQFSFFNEKSVDINKKKICFNGEFEQYICKGLVAKAFPADKWAKYKEHIQAASDFREVLLKETEKAIEYLKEASREGHTEDSLKALLEVLKKYDPRKAYEYLNIEIPTKKHKVKKAAPQDEEYDEEFHQAMEEVEKRSNTKKARNPYNIYIGDKEIFLPNLDKKFGKFTKHTKKYVSRSPSSKRSFLYSSPWAAVRHLHVYKNQTANPSLLTDNSKRDSCKASKSYMAVLRSLQHHVGSFNKAQENLNKVENLLVNKKSKLEAMYQKSLKYLSSTEAEESRFWLREYSRGVDMYKLYAHDKMNDFNKHGIQRWHENTRKMIESKFGNSQSVYLDGLRDSTIEAVSRRTIPSRRNNSLTDIKEFHDLLTGNGPATMERAAKLFSRHNTEKFAESLKQACARSV